MGREMEEIGGWKGLVYFAKHSQVILLLNWEKVFTNNATNKGLIYKIC